MKKLLLTTACILAAGSTASAATITLKGTVRDFKDSHPDFEAVIATELGIVEDTLGPDGKPVYAKGDGSTSATTSGQANFDQWYRDVPGVNQSKELEITLDNTITADPNVYTFIDSTFFPIDGELFGNEGRPHNYHFTFEINSEFTYKGGESFTFTGDDDVFVFINDRLVIDLGGVHPALTQTVNLDDIATDIGLTIGEKYSFDLFFAERHTTQSNFRIDTSIVLEDRPIPVPAPFLLFGSAILGGGLLRKRARG